jgi:hypothetical protein
MDASGWRVCKFLFLESSLFKLKAQSVKLKAILFIVRLRLLLASEINYDSLHFWNYLISHSNP